MDTVLLHHDPIVCRSQRGGGLKSEILKLTVLSIDQKIMYYNHEGIINYQLEPLI